MDGVSIDGFEIHSARLPPVGQPQAIHDQGSTVGDGDPLPNARGSQIFPPLQGLEEDGVHLTWGPVRFDDPENLHKAWPVRNLTAMQMLDAVWAAVADGN